MHAGQFASLEEVVTHSVKAPAATVGHTELAHGEAGHTERKLIRLTEQEIQAVAAFLGHSPGRSSNADALPRCRLGGEGSTR
jgi:cytochrome c peroxidase